MNLFKKIYCRTFQLGFKLIYPFLPYKEPKILNSIDDLPDVFNELKINRVLLITDKGIRGFGITKHLEELLVSRNIHCTVYDNTCANPTVINVEEAKDLYIKEQCQGLIAFGGGSSMDCAKAVGARIAYPKKNLDKLKGLLKVTKKIPPLIAIPTTAGTGSEVTLASVITDTKKAHKYTLMDFTLIPSFAVLDPTVTYSLPPHLTSTTGMDALTHAIEAYIGKSNTKETRSKAITAIKLIYNNIETAYNEPTNYNARKNMLHAAYLAGIAFSKSYVGYVHAIAHSLGGKYNTPHGLANSVILPIVLKEYGKSIYKKLHKLSCELGLSNPNDDQEISSIKFIEMIEELNQKMNIPNHFDFIKEEDIDSMLTHAIKEANPLYPVPKLMDKQELKKLYYLIGNIKENKKG